MTDVFGDPGAMQAAAAGLRLRADQVLDVASRVATAATSAVYEGPAAERFRATSADRHRRLSDAAYQLQDLADTLSRAAADVADAQAEAERIARLAQEDDC